MFWTGVAVALVARFVVGPSVGLVLSSIPWGAYNLLWTLDTVVSLAAYAGASMVAASFVVRVLEQRGVIPVPARDAHGGLSDERSSDL